MPKECEVTEGAQVRVLVVDDHLIPRSFFEGAVRSASGYVLAGSLASAQEAADWCRSHPVDLIIPDATGSIRLGQATRAS